ncbi:MAG TPA: ATP-binding protein [Anaerolineales bacterium]|nr:ATP-binding protein [Anaerolineales bacterium]
MSLVEAAHLLAEPPGSLVYHITVAMALAVTFSQARVYRASGQGVVATRWALASTGLLGVRILSLALAGLAWVNLSSGAPVLPALDRFASLAGILVFAWTVLLPRPSRWVDLALALALLLALIGMGLTLATMLGNPSQEAFNRTRLDQAWSIAGTAVALAATVALPALRGIHWNFNLIPFGLLTLGFALHLGYGPKSGDLQGFVRLSELAAYPLFAIVAARSLITTSRQEAASAKPETDENLLRTDPALSALAEIGPITSANRTADFAARTVEALARAARADLCLLLSTPDPHGQFTIATGYDLIREHHLPGAALSSQDCPRLSRSLSAAKSAIISDFASTRDHHALQEALGRDLRGAALLVPLVTEDEIHGGLLLLSSLIQRTWTAAERRSLSKFAQHLALRFTQLKRPFEPQALGGESTAGSQARLRGRMEELEEEAARLREELEAARAVANMVAPPQAIDKEVEKLRAANAKAQETIRELHGELERLKIEPPDSKASASAEDQLEQLATELQLALRELAEARAELAVVEKKQRDRAAPHAPGMPDVDAILAIAQDLRQPMSSIMGYTELLLGESVGLLGAVQRRFLERVRSGIDRMRALLNDLIQLTALETGTLTLTPEPVNLMGCIEEAVMQVSNAMRSKGIALRMDIPEEVSPILGDQDAVVQILIHLLSNAIGAAQDSSEVLLAARSQPGPDSSFVMLSVFNRGEAIPGHDLGRVFQRNYRADRELVPGVGDTGLGLSIVKALSEAIGGRVWVDSAPDVGTTFTVLLPLTERQPSPAASAP